MSTQMRRRHTASRAMLLIFAWGFGASRAAQAQSLVPSVSTEFAGGSAEIRQFDSDQHELHIQPAMHAELGWPCWWYFRLNGLQPGTTWTVTVSGQPRAFRDGEILDASWCQPERAAISFDQRTWTQTEPGQRAPGNAMVYQVTAQSPTVWMAWGPPFLSTDAVRLLTRLEKSCPGASQFELARSRDGQPALALQMIPEKNTEAPAIWVQARQHAWESGSSWVAAGFIEWTASDDPAAVAFRNDTQIYFVPIMDVDNVRRGAGGKEAVPRDHNRDWTDEPRYPEVLAAQKMIRRLDQTGKLLLFLDLHNPGPGEQQPFFFGPQPEDDLTHLQRQHSALWLAGCEEAIREPLPLYPSYRGARYVKPDEERARMSRHWVADHTSPWVLAVTLETPWNTPHSTIAGYKTVGQQLAEATARYVQRVSTHAAAPGKK